MLSRREDYPCDRLIKRNQFYFLFLISMVVYSQPMSYRHETTTISPLDTKGTIIN